MWFSPHSFVYEALPPLLLVISNWPYVPSVPAWYPFCLPQLGQMAVDIPTAFMSGVLCLSGATLSPSTSCSWLKKITCSTLISGDPDCRETQLEHTGLGREQSEVMCSLGSFPAPLSWAPCPGGHCSPGG